MESLRNLLESRFYVDTCLPFRLWSAPYLFNRLSEAIHWILVNKYGVHHLLHYLDDFLTAGPPDSPVCSYNLTSMLSLCKRINAPVKSSKIEGPSTSITCLGIHLDTIAMEASITPERKEALLVEYQLYWCQRCMKWEVLSLIGKFSFTCKVVPSSSIFLRRLIDLSTSIEKLHYHLPLTQEAKLDMKWWLDFLLRWPGKSLILESHWTLNASMELFTDALGKGGWGAYWAGRWIADHRSIAQGKMSIAWKELYAIAIAVNTWGPHDGGLFGSVEQVDIF